ncbi:11516_t:CDS:1 [Cetraspora pellucida]|uniref:11516_t:CDS:1 n=1 Tax=Cetraspora pellucida TaxID=1433469 RepID=A0ACA9RGB0_9GLOM|nr:11516_t:CDS:1 [Cetraspora pellucida]
MLEDNTSDINSQMLYETNITSSPISSSQSSNKKRNKKSPVWPYFKFDLPAHLGKPVCKKCNDVFLTNTRVSTLRRHLSKHNIIVPARRQTILRFLRTDPHNDED